ncbi:MAG: MFS transporter, partial [Dehalococcoidia bacterium]
MSNDPSSQPAEEPGRQLPKAFRTFQSLVVPSYRNFSIAMFLYFAAMQMITLIRPILAFDLSIDEAGVRSFWAFGITVAGNHLPSLVLSPYAGALADRMSMRIILQWCALAMAVSVGVLAVGVIMGFLEWWHVAIVSVMQGVVMTFITPTRRAIISELVPKSYLLNAVSLNTMNLNVNRVLMPAVAGFISDWFGIQWSLWLIGGVFIGALVLMFTVPLGYKEASAKTRSMAGAMGDGFRYALKESRIRNLLIIGFMATVFGQPLQHLLPMFQDVLLISDGQIGLLFTAMGIGALLGSSASASLGDYQKKGVLLVGFFMVLGVSILVFSFSNIYWLSLFLMLPLGFGHSGRTAVHLAALQSYTDPAMRGRVMALNNMQGGLMPVAII